MSHKQPGLDARHRNENGRIEQKHGNTLVGTLRETYGHGVAPGFRANAKLSTVLRETGEASLRQLLEREKK